MFHVKRGPIDNLTGDGSRPPRTIHRAEGKTARPAGGGPLDTPMFHVKRGAIDNGQFVREQEPSASGAS